LFGFGGETSTGICISEIFSETAGTTDSEIFFVKVLMGVSYSASWGKSLY